MKAESDPVPPQTLFQAREDYLAVARRLFGLLVELAGLEPHHRVLDVGCGAGRLATPIARFLGPDGSYEGFDNSAARIEWCNERIAPLHANMRFRVADVYNGQYNPTAQLQPRDFAFPYEDAEFDLVFLISVFTHMLPDDVEHYLAEIARVLKPGGRTLITWLLLNEEAERLLEASRGERSDPMPNAHKALYGHDFGAFRTTDRRTPEHSIAYYEDWARAAYARAGLAISEPVYHGSWPGREGARNNQDVVIARRP